MVNVILPLILVTMELHKSAEVANSVIWNHVNIVTVALTNSEEENPVSKLAAPRVHPGEQTNNRYCTVPGHHVGH